MITPHATLLLEGEFIQLRCPAGHVSEDIRLDDIAVKQLREWAAQHLALAKKDNAAGLLALGQQMTTWLEGSTGQATRVLEAGSAPMIVEMIVGKLDSSEKARAFLDAPWELLALHGQHLALRADVGLTVIRRIGKAQTPSPAAPHRLGVVFMAAAPHGADNLNYEDEETAILDATKGLGLDLVVEESGTLDLLAACVAREQPEVVQISCHGSLQPEPGLLLEDEVGDVAYVTAAKLSQRLAAHHPRLLFLSACQTAESHAVLDSLAQSLVRLGARAVLGWAAPVLDHEAALFSSLLLRQLSEGMELAQAFGSARLALADHDSLPESPDGSPAARDWHLARLYLEAKGGGVFATAGGPHRLMGRGQAAKTFLDVKGQKVPVAGEAEFVGRRREVQTLLREFRASSAQRHAGVIIHGMGRQGKSSLAARVARRLEHTHEVLVLFGRYDAASILSAFRERISTPEVTALVSDWLPRVEQDAALLLPALPALLEGPCCQEKPGTRPVLLIVDDFEQALEAVADAPHRLKSELVPALRSLIRAFQTAETDSRLLFTCRYEFSLLDSSGQEMTDRLLKVPLHGMTGRESRKQLWAKLRQQTALTLTQQQNLPALVDRLERITAAAQGNPGLQDLLHSLCLESPPKCDACLEQMETYSQTGQSPEEDRVRQFLENLAIHSLIGLLTAPARELLRASTLFQLPVPVPVMQTLATAVGADEHAIPRLLALGLWEVFEDLHDHQQRALALNALVKPLAGELTDEENINLTTVSVESLFECWGAEGGNEEHGSLQSFELTRLALLAQQPRVLVACVAGALRFLAQQFEYKLAAAWAAQVMEILDQAGVAASVDLLRTAAERLTQVGDVQKAGGLLERALQSLSDGHSTGGIDHAATLITHARALVQQGRPDEALKHFQAADALLPQGREKAVVLGDIARIRAAKGEVDAALALQQEMLGIFEGLGDKRSRAVTLGDIARIRAKKGEVDAALALHQEELEVYEGLGDKRSRAVTLGDIARIRAAKGEVDAALALHLEMLGIFEGLGDKRERAVTLGDIARIRADKGEVDAALALHQERLGIFEELGDRDGEANALWSIAKIEVEKQEWQAAYEHLAASYAINLQLGRLDGISFVGLDLGRLLCAAGEQQKGLAILERSLAGFQKLGWAREIAYTEAILEHWRAQAS
ncbi:MAG: CHAT domain-containing protein [Verrucomicrobiaceae bacterium]|nr:CHAT domain-containing protein [Verrucomicrobiaceae bacterium]